MIIISTTINSCLRSKVYLPFVILFLTYFQVLGQTVPAAGLYNFNNYNTELKATGSAGEVVWNSPEYPFTFVSKGTAGETLTIATTNNFNSTMLTMSHTQADLVIDEVIIKSTGANAATAGGEFKLQSLKFAFVTAASRTVKVKAIRDGKVLGDVPVSASAGINSVNVILNRYFYNIDEIRISGFPGDGLRLDDIDIAEKDISNTAPVITSDGAGQTAAITVPENTKTLTTVTATDYQGDVVSFSLVGGADQQKFSLDSNTGHLAFISAPDFELPADADADNRYEVVVRASDNVSANSFDEQIINVTITDVEQGVVSIVRTNPHINPTNAAQVYFTVSFEKSISGISANNFSLTTQNITGASINPEITGEGISRTLSVNTGTVDVNSISGTIRLDMINATGIMPALSNVPYTEGEFYTIENPNPLPVELLSFKAAVKQNKVLLQWATASEQDNKGFEVQRSADGKIFETITFVAGAGNSAEVNTYKTIDHAPLPGTSYYRLKQVDYSGKIEYSAIVSVNIEQLITEVQVAPNPVLDKTTLSIRLPEPQPCVIRLTDATGRVLYTRTLEAAIASQVSLDLSQYAAGIYFVTVQGSAQIFYRGRLLKK